ncbi:hypothetical protein [Geomonas sp.]|uniref:hypothetical protein n=1 Tax=Geomonas sp. TaxID=2651584 RepID=UPI002B46FBC3|nr:hypothetical protein [Geomonas sp.]HJV36904.1 hypothetical protein [Geomonas sp.]
MDTQLGVRRLCSEIQLFDLCDLEYCKQKDGRYCTNPKVLERFEAIKEEDERSQQYLSEEYDEDQEGDEDDYGSDDYEEEDY